MGVLGGSEGEVSVAAWNHCLIISPFWSVSACSVYQKGSLGACSRPSVTSKNVQYWHCYPITFSRDMEVGSASRMAPGAQHPQWDAVRGRGGCGNGVARDQPQVVGWQYSVAKVTNTCDGDVAMETDPWEERAAQMLWEL